MNTEPTNGFRAKRRWLIRDCRGVTLIETLVALGLFSVVAATTSGFLVHQVKTTGINKRQTFAYVLAAEELERVRALDYVDMTAASAEQTLENLAFTVATTVEDDTPATGMKTVSVDVSWPELGGVDNVSVYAIYTQVRR
jgi:prepilin-type N-terminal cleavage/methylation domain-containing protein